jgi:glycosyltransferase involved in cell wall biosynthesis
LLKVLHVIAISGVGGAETLLIDLAQEQQRAGATIGCLFLFRPDKEALATNFGRQLSAGVQVNYRAYENLFSRKTLLFIQNFIAGQKPDIVHTHLKQAETWLSILKWRKRITVPVVSTIHGYRDSYHNRYGLQWKGKQKGDHAYYWLTRFIYRQLDGFIAISHGIESMFRQAGFLKDKHVVTIYHGVRFSSSEKKPAKQKAGFKLVIFGRLVRFKGHIYAIQAMNLLRTKYPAISLDIYGSGPEEEYLMQETEALGLKDHVAFKGFVQNIAATIDAYDLALVPSIGEPFGMVFLESFRAGLPVVAFDLPAGNEIIEHNVSGLLAKPLDEKDLAQQIDRLISNDDLRRSIVLNCQDLLVEKFNLTRMAGEYLSAYEDFRPGRSV